MDRGDDRIKSWLKSLIPLPWQSLLWMSESPYPDPRDRSKETAAEMAARSESAIGSLALANVGDRVQIVALNSGEANSRLMGMGLMPGALLEVMSSSATGSVVVALHDHRLGLAADMAKQIQVIHAEGQAGIQQDTFLTQRNSMQRNPIMPAPPGPSGIKLRDAAIGSTLRVIGYEPTARDYKRKLLAMGLTPKTEITVKRHAPLGDPTEIEVRGFRLSLRKDEADALLVEPVLGVES